MIEHIQNLKMTNIGQREIYRKKKIDQYEPLDTRSLTVTKMEEQFGKGKRRTAMKEQTQVSNKRINTEQGFLVVIL